MKKKDNLIILAVLIIVAGGYLLVKQPWSQPNLIRQSEHGHASSMSDAMQNIGDLPEDYEGLIAMGNKNMDVFNYPMAAECYRRALLLDSSSLDVRTDYGACLHGMGLLDRAREEFTRVLAVDESHPIANYNLGIVFYNMDNNDSARYYWERFLVLEPEGQVSESVRNVLKEMSGS
ncbi:MAG: tetratricopeptide repeat protein [Candidatus Zixiibacteriota bacterium]